MKETDLNNMLNDVLDKDTAILKINLELLLKAFDCLDEEARRKEFAKLAVSHSILKSIIDDVRALGEEEFVKILKKDDFFNNVMHRIGCFLEIGADLGYAKRVEPEKK